MTGTGLTVGHEQQEPPNLVIVRSVVEQGLTPAQAAAKFGLSRQWVRVLVGRYQASGTDALEPRSRAPRARPVSTAPAVRGRVLDLRCQLVADGADAGPITIAWHLTKEGIHAPSTSTIRASCTRND